MSMKVRKAIEMEKRASHLDGAYACCHGADDKVNLSC